VDQLGSLYQADGRDQLKANLEGVDEFGKVCDDAREFLFVVVVVGYDDVFVWRENFATRVTNAEVYCAFVSVIFFVITICF
jgi:hypothetical protein